MFSFRDASCWRVEVMKGGAGERFLSCRFTLFTVKGVSFTASVTVLTSSPPDSSIRFSRP